MRNRATRRSVEIFNFSFLDVLACTIGLLIFIMVMVFILQTGSSSLANIPALAQSRTATQDALRAQAVQDQRIAASLEQTLANMPPVRPSELPACRQEAVARRDRERTAMEAASPGLVTAETALREANGHRAAVDQAARAARQQLAQAQADRQQAQRNLAEVKRNPPKLLRLKGIQANARDFTILHVDCRSDRVELLAEDKDGHPQLLGSTPAGDLDVLTSTYQKLLVEYGNKKTPLVLFWVRPDGIGTFESASKCVPSSMAHGFEPADASMTLVSPQLP